MVGIVTFAAKLDERYEIGIREQFPTALKSCYFFSNYTYIFTCAIVKSMELQFIFTFLSNQDRMLGDSFRIFKDLFSSLKKKSGQSDYRDCPQHGSSSIRLFVQT